MSGISFPAHAKIVGLWLQADPNAAGASQVAHHRDLWLQWDWEGCIKPQIDYALSIGVNTLAVKGDAYSVAAGTLSASSYAAMHAQIAEYLAGKGAHYMPCLAAAYPYSDYALSASALSDISAALMHQLAEFGNVVGVYAFDEPNNASVTPKYLIDYINALRSNGSGIPVTVGIGIDTAPRRELLAELTPHLDYLAIHTATFPCPSTFLDDYLLGTNLEVIIGSTYKNMTANAGTGGGSAEVAVSDLRTVYKLAMSGHPRIRGVLQWAAGDFGSEALFPNASDETWPAAKQFGVFDNSTTPGVFVERRHFSRLIRQFSRGSLALSKSV